jgi:hypothetical protein
MMKTDVTKPGHLGFFLPQGILQDSEIQLSDLVSTFGERFNEIERVFKLLFGQGDRPDAGRNYADEPTHAEKEFLQPTSLTGGSVRYFRTVTSVTHFRVIAGEVVFFLTISLETLRCAQQLKNLFMFLYQKGVSGQKCSHQVTLSAVHWQVAPLHRPLSSSPRTLFSEGHF